MKKFIVLLALLFVVKSGYAADDNIWIEVESTLVPICGNVIDINGSPRFSILTITEVEGN